MNQSNQVHAPYHFVPLSKWVHMPDWAHLVSHDVPFKDGYSGVLEYTLTNATPLCVGGEQEQKKDAPSLVKWARDPNGKPVIPGSSLKGMIRSVLEIASFGKFAAIDDNHFSYRDISSPSYLEAVIKQNNTTAAWLKYDSDKLVWTLHNCQFAKIKHADIKQALSVNLRNDTPAIAKYAQLPLSKTIKVDIFQKTSKTQGSVNWVKDIGQGPTHGNLVFCNARIMSSKTAKPSDYEFSYCFYGALSAVRVDSAEINALANNLFVSHDESQVAYLQRNQHPEFGIPVFALLGKKDRKVNALGLAKMPRVLYRHAASDLAQAQQGNARISKHYFDMAELIFGTLREKGLGLKSRVFFADATLTNDKGLVTSKNVTLNGPKATFQAAYLEQPIAKEYQYYDGNQSKLAGWKRYITAPKFTENVNTSDNTKVQTRIELLNPLSQFNGKVVFHNLKQQELGALIWALQLGNELQAKQTYHGLGHGKSLGAGAVQLSLQTSKLHANNASEEEHDIQAYLDSFVTHMTANYPGHEHHDWQNSPQIKHLQAIANMQENKDRDLSYHPLGDYRDIKKRREALAPIELNNAPLNRVEPNTVSAKGALSFAQGRLAALFDDSEHDDIWIKNENSKQKVLQDAVSDQFSLAKQQQQEAEEAFRLATLPAEFTKISELQAALDKALIIDDKRALSSAVDALLNEGIAQEWDGEAAKQLFSIVGDKKRCEYLAIKDKKKLKPRKAKHAELGKKYSLQET
jgi:CRISPR-associated protein (TIGR03986 family)